MGLFNKTPEDKAMAVWKSEYLVVRTEAKTWMDMKVDKDAETIASRSTGDSVAIRGAKASVETEGEIRDRFTATRILAIGIFALAFKKKTSDKDVFIVIENGDDVVTFHVPSKHETKARAWARRFNTVAQGPLVSA